jgi:heme a synthase
LVIDLLTFVLVLVAILVLISVLAAGRKDLRGLALGQVLGIVGQGILGGITVLTGLHPATVAAHFLLSIILIAGATSLRAQRHASLEKQVPAPLVKKIATAHHRGFIPGSLSRNIGDRLWPTCR